MVYKDKGKIKMTLYYLPIQKLESRYTEQWYRWFPEEFKKRGLKPVIIDGDILTKTIEKGAFLDVNGAHYWGLSQLMNVSRIFHEGRVKDGDKFFVADIEFPGHAEAIMNMAYLQGINIELYGFLHACSVTTEDYVQPLQDSMKYYELGWLSSYDKIFVGSDFFRGEVISKRINVTAPKEDRESLAEKLVVTGNPWNSKEILTKQQPIHNLPSKKKQIIFPNRFDFDKRPNLFLDLCMILADEVPDLKFIITSSRPTMRSCQPWLIKLYHSVKKALGDRIDFEFGLSKFEYYNHLAESKLMFSSSVYESFGYCPLEAMTFGTIPVCPNKFSYPEVIGSSEFLYNNMDEAIEKTLRALDGKRTFDNTLSRVRYYNNSINRMIDEMTEFD